jgi:hypothetical protein
MGEGVGIPPYLRFTFCVSARSIATVTAGRPSLSAMDTMLVLGDGVVDFGISCEVPYPFVVGRSGVAGTTKALLVGSTRCRLEELENAIMNTAKKIGDESVPSKAVRRPGLLVVLVVGAVYTLLPSEAVNVPVDGQHVRDIDDLFGQSFQLRLRVPEHPE